LTAVEHFAVRSGGVLYVSYHGGASHPGTNVDLIDERDYVARNVLDTAGLPDGVPFEMLRGIRYGPDGALWVANAHKHGGEILRFAAECTDGKHRFLGIAASTCKVKALVHPYDFAFIPGAQRWFVSSQNTNVVTGSLAVDGPGPLAIAPALRKEHPETQFLPGTFVASAAVGLGGPEVPPPAGLCAKGEPDELKHSVRGLAHNGTWLFVADEAADQVKAYDVRGKLVWCFPDPADGHKLRAPVQLVLDGERHLLVGSSDNDEIVRVKIGGHAHEQVAKVKSVSGIALDETTGTIYAASRRKNVVMYGQPGSTLVPYGPAELADEPEFVLIARP
jgi:hypothetical protein